MNSAAPELAAFKYLYPYLVKGGVIIFDDYGQPGHENQKSALDEFCVQIDKYIFPLPTGQGLFIK